MPVLLCTLKLTSPFFRGADKSYLDPIEWPSNENSKKEHIFQKEESKRPASFIWIKIRPVGVSSVSNGKRGEEIDQDIDKREEGTTAKGRSIPLKDLHCTSFTQEPSYDSSDTRYISLTNFCNKNLTLWTKCIICWVIKENPANDNYKSKCNTNSNNNSNKPNNIKGIKGNCFDNTLSVEQNLSNLSKRYNEILNKGNKTKSVPKS